MYDRAFNVWEKFGSVPRYFVVVDVNVVGAVDPRNLPFTFKKFVSVITVIFLLLF